MIEKNYGLHFENMRCTIFDPFLCEIMSVNMKEKSFPLKLKQIVMQAFPCKVDDSTLWHKRIGHFSYSTLRLMKCINLVQNMPSIEEHDDVCDVCQYGKKSKLPFPAKASWRTIEKLKLIH